MAYIAEQMEVRGDKVDWDTLYMGAISPDQGRPHSLLSAVSECVCVCARSCLCVCMCVCV